jgi:hypothetical protein
LRKGLLKIEKEIQEMVRIGRSKKTQEILAPSRKVDEEPKKMRQIEMLIEVKK